jgi:hypothetical protein
MYECVFLIEQVCAVHVCVCVGLTQIKRKHLCI